ncbi:MAG TPA: hypothetical protein VHD61_10090 [Lacunisphaera sp.]|nr:hypothetical protein [Lacunisphaera sp.]
MRVLRILVAGLVALAAMTAVLLAGLVVVVTGAVAWALQLFRPAHLAPVAPPPAAKGTPPAGGEAIDVETTRVPPGPPEA